MFLFEHDLFGTPVSTFPDHALVLLRHKPPSFRGKAAGLEPGISILACILLQQHRDSGLVRFRRTPRNDVFAAQ
jgi:hypothetical protein